jgi:hypothetical protein
MRSALLLVFGVCVFFVVVGVVALPKECDNYCSEACSMVYSQSSKGISDENLAALTSILELNCQEYGTVGDTTISRRRCRISCAPCST